MEQKVGNWHGWLDEHKSLLIFCDFSRSSITYYGRLSFLVAIGIGIGNRDAYGFPRISFMYSHYPLLVYIVDPRTWGGFRTFFKSQAHELILDQKCLCYGLRGWPAPCRLLRLENRVCLVICFWEIDRKSTRIEAFTFLGYSVILLPAEYGQWIIVCTYMAVVALTRVYILLVLKPSTSFTFLVL